MPQWAKLPQAPHADLFTLASSHSQGGKGKCGHARARARASGCDLADYQVRRAALGVLLITVGKLVDEALGWRREDHRELLEECGVDMPEESLKYLCCLNVLGTEFGYHNVGIWMITKVAKD